ncbi:MAG: hypothetical protein U0326_43275 [Polyangiales bacterium]
MWGSTRGLCALWLVAAMLLNGCFQYRTIRGDELGRPPGSRPEDVRVTLRDGTRVDFESPSLYDRGIDGTVTACDGPSCADVTADRNVRFTAVSRIEARESGAGHAARTTGIVIGATLGTALLVGVIGLIVVAASGGLKMEFSSSGWRGGY